MGIAREETDENEENPVKYLATNKIDTPTEHVILSHGMRWLIETFFEDSTQDIGLGDYAIQTNAGASADWHLRTDTWSFSITGRYGSPGSRQYRNHRKKRKSLVR